MPDESPELPSSEHPSLPTLKKEDAGESPYTAHLAQLRKDPDLSAYRPESLEHLAKIRSDQEAEKARDRRLAKKRRHTSFALPEYDSEDDAEADVSDQYMDEPHRLFGWAREWASEGPKVNLTEHQENQIESLLKKTQERCQTLERRRDKILQDIAKMEGNVSEMESALDKNYALYVSELRSALEKNYALHVSKRHPFM